MINKQITKFENKYEKYLSDKSVLELVTTLRYLDEEKPYAELVKNGDVRELIQKEEYQNIPIDNMKDFNLFYKSLWHKIAELGDGKKVNIFLEQANYRRESMKLPQLMNKLENISLEQLKPKFKAVMEYVYDAVMNEGFEMKNEGIYISKQYKEVWLGFSNRLGLANRTRFKLNKKKGELKIRTIMIVDEHSKDKTINETFSSFKYIFLNETDEKRVEHLKSQIKKILSLPTIMNYYLKKKISNLEGCLKE